MPAIVNVTRASKKIRAVVFARPDVKHLRVSDLLAFAHALEGPDGIEIPRDAKIEIRRDTNTGEYVEMSAECEVVVSDVP